MDSIKNYSTIIKLSKGAILLAIVAIVSAIMFLFYDNLSSKRQVSQIVFNEDLSSKSFKDNQLEATSDNPRFFGVNSENKPYTIFAKKGIQINKQLVELIDVNANMDIEQGDFAIMRSDKAILELDQDNLAISGNVEILVPNKYTITTEQAFINYKKHSGYGNSPIQIKTATAIINADEFIITDNHKELILKGKRVKTLVSRLKAEG